MQSSIATTSGKARKPNGKLGDSELISDVIADMVSLRGLLPSEDIANVMRYEVGMPRAGGGLEGKGLVARSFSR